ncbi:MAG: acetyl esterase [Bacteroidetes bacterium ADurb.BinA174]|jgi:acetyl esterase/lipase|nr:MAG: acetyl esterase [Bacteroidetes bacterium ADurb.BinA174]
MKLTLKLFLGFFLFAILFSACSQEEVFEVINEPKTIIDAAYGNDEAQKADIFLPEGRSQADTRVLLIIHGGGWYTGDKKDMDKFVSTFQSKLKSYAVVNMNYRLVTFSPVRYMLPTQTDDIRLVMDYMAKNASDFGIKPEFVLLGLSAGGHLAMLYSYKYDKAGRVKAAVNIVGPCDLSDDAYKNNFIFNLGMNYITDPAHLPSGMSQSTFGSPVHWITRNAPPTISFYGNTDKLIPLSQPSTLEQALNQYNIPNEKYIYPGGHTEASYDQSDDIVAKTVTFLTTHVR